MRQSVLLPLVVFLAASACTPRSDPPGQPKDDADATPDSSDTDDEADPTTPARKPFVCDSGPIELREGSFELTASCSLSGGLLLGGDAELVGDGADLTIDGDLVLEENGALRMTGGVLTIANSQVFEHRIAASGDAVIDLRDLEVRTNSGVPANVTSNYDATDRALLRAENVHLDVSQSWVLANLTGEARLELINTRSIPTEIYPADSASVRIEGPSSDHGIWLPFPAGASATLAALPSTPPFTFSFGRDSADVSGIGYQVDIVNGAVGLGIISYPGSNLTVRDSDQVPISYMLANVTTEQVLTGLRAGTRDLLFEHQGRRLALENAQVFPFGWQIYNDNSGITAEEAAPVVIADSFVNEVGGAMNARVHVRDSVFGFAVLGAVGPNARVQVERSIINSQTLLAQYDAVLEIRDSEIFGSLVQAAGSSRVLLINTPLRTNTCHARCQPMCLSLDGGTATQCNGFNPATDVELVATEEAAIIALGVHELAMPVARGERVTFSGDVLVESRLEGLGAYTFDLGYMPAGGGDSTPIAVAQTGPRRAEALGELDTSALAPGTYVAVLELRLGGTTLAASRPFVVTASMTTGGVAP
ncbi:MAG: hypothetical protein ACAI38_01430 [Myxococcota bacterium]